MVVLLKNPKIDLEEVSATLAGRTTNIGWKKGLPENRLCFCESTVVNRDIATGYRASGDLEGFLKTALAVSGVLRAREDQL